MLIKSQICYRIKSAISLIMLGLLFGCMRETLTTVQYKQATHLSQIDEILSHSGYKAEDILDPRGIFGVNALRFFREILPQ